MPNTPHLEKHFTSSEVVRDIVIGMADGLTVPFALAAGLSGAVDGTRIIVVAGLAEIAAGAIAMGLGGYLAAKNDAEHYASELKREELEVIERTEDEEAEVREILGGYGLRPEQADPIISHFKANPKKWVDWMMRFELGLEAPDPGRALRSALTIALSYIVGGLIPLAPYIFISDSRRSLWISVFLTIVALFLFGYVKGRFTAKKPLWSGIQTALIGAVAAGAAFFIARLFS